MRHDVGVKVPFGAMAYGKSQSGRKLRTGSEKFQAVCRKAGVKILS